MKNAWTKKLGVAVPLALAAAAVASPAFADDTTETAYIFNTFSFLINGVLVMWMAAGFAMLESGLVRSKNVATICVKNIGLYAIAGLAYYLVGYNLMYNGVGEGGFMGIPGLFSAAAPEVKDGMVADAYSGWSDWFFQMVFVATTASIVSGTVAERIKLWPFFAFIAVLTLVIYPIQGAWSWGGGFLSANGFSDFAGSTIVHSVGGWAALTGAIILGARKGKFSDSGIRPMPGSSLPLSTLGTFILWMGWFGFNGGSVLALGDAASADSMAKVFANTNTAASAGCVAAMILTQIIYKKVDLTMALNGALAGLVSITAEPLTPSLGSAMMIGAIGGVLVVLAVPMLDKLKIDDVVGAIPVHLVCGIWGTLAVPLTNADASFGAQIMGIVSVAIFVSVASAIVWFALKVTVGIRMSEEAEEIGGDREELGLEAYPEFGRGSQKL